VTGVGRRGRPRQCPDEVLRRVLAMRAEGLTYQTICDTLNTERIRTPGGKPKWWRSHVSRLLHTRSAMELRQHPV
jgi:hypothetical protein